MRAYLHAVPGLTGKGNPLANGVHLQDVRSPSSGAIAQQTLIGPTAVDDAVHSARLSYEVSAVGSEDGAIAEAGRAARALASALHALRTPRTVTTRAGELVRLLTTGDVSGPVQSGQVGNRAFYTVEATVLAQPG